MLPGPQPAVEQAHAGSQVRQEEGGVALGGASSVRRHVRAAEPVFVVGTRVAEDSSCCQAYRRAP